MNKKTIRIFCWHRLFKDILTEHMPAHDTLNLNLIAITDEYIVSNDFKIIYL